MAQTSNLRGIIYMLASGFTFVLNDSLLKLAMVGLPPYEVLVMRGLSGAFFALVLLGLNGELKFQSAFISRPVILRAVLECGAILTYIIALAHAPIGDVTAIFQTTPLLVIMGMIFIHGEQAALWRLGLIVLGFIGALLVAQPGQGTISPFVMLAFLTAVFAALRDLAARKIDPSIPAMFSTLVLIVTVLSTATLVSGISMWAANHLGVAATRHGGCLAQTRRGADCHDLWGRLADDAGPSLHACWPIAALPPRPWRPSITAS